MKERWKNGPEALKRKVIKRICMGLLFCVIGIVAWIISKRFLFALPCFAVSAVLGLSGANVLFAVLMGRYIILSGTCERVDQTLITKRTKAMYLTTNYGTVKVLIRHNGRRVQVGAYVYCYISLKVPVYEFNDIKVVNDYYAVELMN